MLQESVSLDVEKQYNDCFNNIKNLYNNINVISNDNIYTEKSKYKSIKICIGRPIIVKTFGDNINLDTDIIHPIVIIDNLIDIYMYIKEKSIVIDELNYIFESSEECMIYIEDLFTFKLSY